MYGFFKNLLGDYFTDDMWTSHASAKYTDQTFDGDDSQFADFTIRDLSGRFTDWLVERGCKQPKEWLGKNGKDSITYSIEVKATYGSRTEPFHISQNQIDMVSGSCSYWNYSLTLHRQRSNASRVMVFLRKSMW